jgi:hypothetical protein
MKNKDFTIGWSDFAKERNVRGKGFSFSTLTNDQVLELVRENWDKAIPGTGEKDLSRKILIPVDSDSFFTSTAILRDDMPLAAMVTKRRPEEDSYVQNFITPNQAYMNDIKPEEANFVKIVCYSAEALDENNERSTDCDWEIIAIVGSTVENEPMTPLAMARNMLDKEGGTKSEYTAEEFAEAVYYWSQRVRIMEYK